MLLIYVDSVKTQISTLNTFYIAFHTTRIGLCWPDRLPVKEEHPVINACVFRLVHLKYMLQAGGAIYNQRPITKSEDIRGYGEAYQG